MMTGWIRELVTDLMGPDRPVAVFLPASPADGTQIRKRASGGNPLQITCTGHDVLFAKGGPTSVILPHPGEQLWLEYWRLDGHDSGVWVAIDTTGEPS